MLFSDLTGSTALYTKVGDAAAFRLVDDHFDVMRAHRRRSRRRPREDDGRRRHGRLRRATSACARRRDALWRASSSSARTSEHGAHVGLKLGTFAGPCYVVTANGALDYFGQTVNVASRVQHLAGVGRGGRPRTSSSLRSPESDRRALGSGSASKRT